MFQADVPLAHGMIVIAIIVVLYRLFLALVRKNERFERFATGELSCIISEGRILLPALTHERISQEELFEILRVAGVMQLGEVRRAFLEQSGSLSVFAYAPTYACMRCGDVHTQTVAGELRRCPSCNGESFTKAVTTPSAGEGVKTR